MIYFDITNIFNANIKNKDLYERLLKTAKHGFVLINNSSL